MDSISNLPDDLLLRILSRVQTKTVFDAQVVSKRWRNLWKILPSLNYDYACHKSEDQFLAFIHRTMELLESPVLESLHLRVAPTETSTGVLLREELVAKRPLRELDMISTSNPDRSKLNYGIYQLQKLVILRVESFCLGDFYRNQVPLKSLKVLQLCRVKYSSDESLSNLLSSLPSLQDLILDQCLSATRHTTLAIAVPCLKRLTVVRCPHSCWNHQMVLHINAPSLNYLSVEDYWRNVSFSDVKMEELIEADVNVTYIHTETLVRSFTSVERLSLCLLTSKVTWGNIVFDRLVRLEICTCQKEWWNLLGIILVAPKLRILKLHQKHCFGIVDPAVKWNEPSFVPECFASHLETFEWRGYEGTEEEKELANYILRNARRLKIATIYPLISHPDKISHEILKNYMRKELEDLSQCRFTCKLVFK